MPKNDYSLADFERAYRTHYPDWSRRDIRVAAKEQYRLYSEANPNLILDIHDLRDPTCGDAVHNIRTQHNHANAARKVNA